MFLSWNDLTEAEKEQVANTYLCIREGEEQRDRNEVTEEYPEPMDWRAVKGCRFERQNNGYVDVII